MTRRDAESFAAKRPAGERADPRMVRAIETRVKDNEYACRDAEQIASELAEPMEKIGATLDLLGIRIARCQLGLFGYSPESRVVKAADRVTAELEGAIRQALVNDRLPCAAAWAVAKALGLPRMKVAEACESLKIKIKPCQLGAF